MTRLFFTLLIGLIGIAVAASAIADTIPRRREVCPEPQMGLPTTGTLSRLTPAQMALVSEVVVTGTIESYQAPTYVGGKNIPGLVIVHVDKVWKGDVTPRVAYLTYVSSSYSVETEWEWPSQAAPVDCSNSVRAGVQIRIGASIFGKMSKLSAMFPAVDGNMDVLDGASPFRISFWGLIYLPLHDTEIDSVLAAYHAKTDAMQQAATAGDQQANLVFAEYLLDHYETNRAFAIYDDLAAKNQNDLDLLLTLSVARTKARIEGEPEATLAVVREKAPKTEKWRSKIARARLAATSLLTAEGKDWSDLKRMHTTCYSDHENFNGTLFDRAELPNCAFRYSSFRNASFRGTDLTGSYFQNSDLTGAKYDCATNLPEDLDPAAAGMINVEGSCHPAP